MYTFMVDHILMLNTADSQQDDFYQYKKVHLYVHSDNSKKAFSLYHVYIYVYQNLFLITTELSTTLANTSR